MSTIIACAPCSPAPDDQRQRQRRSRNQRVQQISYTCTCQFSRNQCRQRAAACRNNTVHLGPHNDHTVALISRDLWDPIHAYCEVCGEDVDGYVADAKSCLESLGFRVKVDASCSKRYGFLSGTDEERAAALERAFCDDEVDGVWCIKGGYGCARMVELVDWAKIAAHPKAFIG